MTGKQTHYMIKPTPPLQYPSLSGKASVIGNFISAHGQRVKNESNATNVVSSGAMTMASNQYPRTNAVGFVERTMRDLRGAAVPLKRKDSESMRKFASTFTGGQLPIPASDKVPFKRQFMPGNGTSDIRVRFAKLQDVYGGNFGQDMRCILPLVLNGDKYGTVSRNPEAMKKLLPAGAPAFVKRRKYNEGKDAQTEVVTVFDINKTQKQLAIQGSKRIPTCEEFYRVWSDCGTIVAFELAIPSFGDANNLFIMNNFGQADELPNLWLDWPERLHIGATCWLVWQMRSEGYEDEERDFMLRGEPGMFRQWLDIKLRNQFQLQKAIVEHNAEYEMTLKTLQERAASAGTSTSQLPLPAGMNRYADGNGLVLAHEKPRPVSSIATATRYGRWEPYVTAGGRSVPTWVTNGVNPDGTTWSGRARRVATILQDHREFDFADRWRVQIRAILYANPLAPAGAAENTADMFNRLPKFRAYVYAQ
jgi:hypothetical protein